ncbi:MAG: hypothetical protein PHD05_02215, partial [Sphaerochaetaceae bacterium]|nr:hypothetical protein [Sphaerochaetaceae bacterium]
VVIALVVVGLLLQILGNFGGANETALKTSWKTAEPWAIQDWSKTGDAVSIVLKNNTSETLQFNSITLQGSDANTTPRSNVAPGATITIIGTSNATACTPGSKYSYPKSGIEIDYNTTSISNKIQYGVADIAGTC